MILRVASPGPVPISSDLERRFEGLLELDCQRVRGISGFEPGSLFLFFVDGFGPVHLSKAIHPMND